MEKLIKPSQYAKELGISRQAVYAKIKKGILAAKEVNGQLYIDLNDVKDVDKSVKTSTYSQNRQAKNISKQNTKRDTANQNANHETIGFYKDIINSKDETIGVLKGTVKDLKESNTQIYKTLRSEVSLLKEAFGEMRSLYKGKIEHMQLSEKRAQFQSNDIPVYSTKETKSPKKEKKKVEEKEVIEADMVKSWISAKKFLKNNNIRDEYQQARILKALRKAYKKGDARFRIIDGKFKLKRHKNYDDILEAK